MVPTRLRGCRSSHLILAIWLAAAACGREAGASPSQQPSFPSQGSPSSLNKSKNKKHSAREFAKTAVDLSWGYGEDWDVEEDVDEDDGAVLRPSSIHYSQPRALSTGLPSNMALYMDATLATTGSHTVDGLEQEGSAEYLVDGSRDTDFFSGSGCAETKKMPNAWARIDFGREVPMARVKIWTRTDDTTPGLGPINLYAGNSATSWRDNLLCNAGIYLSRETQPTNIACIAGGRYLWIVLKIEGARTKPLSLCEVEVIAHGPSGTQHSLQTAGEMFDLVFEGYALSSADRIRIVDNTVLCGERVSNRMDENVLDITSPIGTRDSGGSRKERWNYVQIDRVGVYKVCWCAGSKDCSYGINFDLHIATIVVNGVMITAAGNGSSVANESMILSGETGTNTPLTEPFGIAVTSNRVFVSERYGHRVRYMDIATQKMYVLAGGWNNRYGSDNIAAKDTELSYPMGIALSPDHSKLYIADSGSHRIRMVKISGTTPEGNTITTVAGNGYQGFSGDGDSALLAQLDTPSCVTEDYNNFLWICDTGNNRIRVVSQSIQVQVPGTNTYATGIILTAAGDGQDALEGDVGDGDMATGSQIGGPMAIAVGDEYVDSDLGRVPTSLYVSETNAQAVRSIQLHFESYKGVITTIVGSRVQGDSAVREGVTEAATLVELNSPMGVASDINTGNVYVSDTSNNRVLMLPTFEYASLGCWRENLDNPLIPSIEDEDDGTYLDGDPESRDDAINKCALAALSRGNVMFAVRLMGTCATSSTAQLVYQDEGESTSCSDGIGGTKDNSVYKFVRHGPMVEQLGLVYTMSGRDGTSGFGGDSSSAWDATLSRPAGIAVGRSSGDIWIADPGNNRVRMVFSQIGPDKDHEVYCTNGFECSVTLTGNGLQSHNRLGVMPASQECGEVSVAEFQTGFELNPVQEDESTSFTEKTYNFGSINMLETGAFRLCFCIIGNSVFGKVTDCSSPDSFIKDAGLLYVVGAANNVRSTIQAVAGLSFDILLTGERLSNFDRIRIVEASMSCAGTGAASTTDAVMNKSLTDSARTFGNVNSSIWSGVKVQTLGDYLVCWCRGVDDDDLQLPCNTDAEFLLPVASIRVIGPSYSEQVLTIGTTVDVILTGGGLSAGNRIRMVDQDIECGTELANTFTAAIYPDHNAPNDQADIITADTAVWKNILVRSSTAMKVCWCGGRDGCAFGEDFNILAKTIFVQGPTTLPMQKYNVSAEKYFRLNISGHYLTGTERIRIVETYTECGSTYANEFSEQVPFLSWPTGNPFFYTLEEIGWDAIWIWAERMYRVCLCTCTSTLCCTTGADFFVEAAVIYAHLPENWEKAWEVLDAYEYSYEVASYNASKDIVPDPTHWDQVPKDRKITVTVTAKTREEPEHAGSDGPFYVRLLTAAQEEMSPTITMTNLLVGQTRTFSSTFYLDRAMVPDGIEIIADTTDAWFCEYIQVNISWLNVDEDITTTSIGSNRFAVNSWSVAPAMAADRVARRLTDNSGALITEERILPEPEVAIWEQRYFVADACGGCNPGYRCEHKETPDSMLYKVELSSGGELTGTGWLAHCAPICGDGYTVVGEQCDDGNIRSFDGCSGQCEVEHGFECYNMDNATSICFPRLCHNVSDDGVTSYGSVGVEQADTWGYLFHANWTVEHPGWALPGGTAFVCYVWEWKELCPLDSEGLTASFSMSALNSYRFSWNISARVDVFPYTIDYVGSGMNCDSPYYYGEEGRDGYASYEDCELQCFLDDKCRALTFWIATDGGKECPDGYTSQRCGARCRLHSEECPTNVTLDVDSPPAPDAYYLGVKRPKTPEEIGRSLYFCSELPIPKPARAHESDGVVTVTFDGPVEGFDGALSNYAFIDGEEFDCSTLLSEDSYESVGGAGSICRAVMVDTLKIFLGPLATLRRTKGFDSQRQIYGDPALLFFDSTALRPRGMTKDYWVEAPQEFFPIFVHTTRPMASRDGGYRTQPKVIIRGPTMLGGCGPLELSADTSNMGGGRRWKSAKWTCLGTRIMNDTMNPISNSRAKEVLDSCDEGGTVYELLQSKPWCDSDEETTADIARSCELRIVIPSEAWCGMSKIQFRVNLTTSDGVSGIAEWTTEIMLEARVPAAAAVGDSEVTVQPQIEQGADLPVLRLEVSTQPDFDMIGSCTCKFASAPATDGSEAAVSVNWFYGQVLNGKNPSFWDMYEVSGDTSDAVNVLELPMQGDFLVPQTSWLFYARVAYEVYEDDEATFVPFHVTVAPLKPPKAVLRAPLRVSQEYCSFVVDASETKLLDFLYWTNQARRLQVTSNTTTTTDKWAVKTQSLVFQWDLVQLSLSADDSSDTPSTVATSALAYVRALTSSVWVMPQQALPEGLYVLKMYVIDAAFPSILGEANVTFEVHSEERPTYVEVLDKRTYVAGDDVTTKFVQYGFSSCPIPFDLPSLASGTIMLMRGLAGEQPDKFEAIAELATTTSFSTVSDEDEALTFTATANSSLLLPGFTYKYRLLSTSIAHEEMNNYAAELLQESRRHNASDPAARYFKREPLVIPDWVWVDDGLPFTIVAEPTGGTLEILEPIGGIGYSMKDTFKFMQLWATDSPPLEYTFFYAVVSPDKEEEFDAVRELGFTDSATTDRLSALVETGWITLSSWSHDPTLSTPLPAGLYVIGSKVRDANGMMATRMAAVKVLASYKSKILTAFDRLEYLDEYIDDMNQAILQVRGANRGAAAIVPVAAAVDELPDLRSIDFKTMLNYYNTSGDPDPRDSQELYGTPIAGRALHAKVKAFVEAVLAVLSDIINSLDTQTLGISTASNRRLATEEESTTSLSHIQAIAFTMKKLSLSVGPLQDSELFLTLGNLVVRLLDRIQDARLDIMTENEAAQNLMSTMSTMVAAIDPADLYRDGVVEVNTSKHIQVRLSGIVNKGLAKLADAVAAYLDEDVEERLVGEVPAYDPLDSQNNVTLGSLKLSVFVQSFSQVRTLGISVLPDYEDEATWAYPRFELSALGEPGYWGSNWASEDTADESAARYQAATCYQESEEIFDRIVVMFVSWPIDPMYYATGTMIASTANVTVPYTVMLRSCGEEIDIGDSDGNTGKVSIIFRLETDTVRDRRWGYGSVTPYRVAWWEDLEGIGTAADRIRRWTTSGCITTWSNAQEDIVEGACDRLPIPKSGSVFAVELVERPTFVSESPDPENANIHNLATYLFVVMALRFWYLWYCAQKGDVKFWPTEADILKIIFMPAEYRWRDRGKRGLRLQPPPPDLRFSGKALSLALSEQRLRDAAQEANAGAKLLFDRIRAVVIFVVACIKTIGGAELFSRLEVRELQCMRHGRRDVVYQHYLEAMDDKEHAQKIAVHTFNKVQKAMLASKEQQQQQQQLQLQNSKAAWEDNLYHPYTAPALENSRHDYSNPALTAGYDTGEGEMATLRPLAGPAPTEPPPPLDVEAEDERIHNDFPEGESLAGTTAQAFGRINSSDEHLHELREAVKDIVARPDGYEGDQEYSNYAAGDDGGRAVMLMQQGQQQQQQAAGSGQHPLATGWEQFISEEHGGRVYYHCPATGQTSWERPTQMPDGSVVMMTTEVHVLAPESTSMNPSPRAAGSQQQPQRKHKLGTLRGAAQNTFNPRDFQAAGRPGHQLRKLQGHHAPPPAAIFEEAPLSPPRQSLRAAAQAAPDGPAAPPLRVVDISDDDDDIEAKSHAIPQFEQAGSHAAAPPNDSDVLASSTSARAPMGVPPAPPNWVPAQDGEDRQASEAESEPSDREAGGSCSSASSCSSRYANAGEAPELDEEPAEDDQQPDSSLGSGLWRALQRRRTWGAAPSAATVRQAPLARRPRQQQQQQLQQLRSASASSAPPPPPPSYARPSGRAASSSSSSSARPFMPPPPPPPPPPSLPPRPSTSDSGCAGEAHLEVEERARPRPTFRPEAEHAMPPKLAEPHDSEAFLREQVMMAIEAAGESQEVVLPSGWEMHSTEDGRDFYVHLVCGLTQWEVPKLPAHWEERVARDGKVYYLNLFDGRTQWEWPQESASTRLMLALPGATEASIVQRPDDMRSESSIDSAVFAADQLDAAALLALPPGKAKVEKPEEEILGDMLYAAGAARPEEQWGRNEKEKGYKVMKQDLNLQRVAHEKRFATARAVPGVRDFIRPHEMAEITNNWDRQVDNVALVADNHERQKRQLGDKSELKKEDLRVQFPVIQRMQWTKWEPLEIFIYCLMHTMPSQTIFLNLAFPSKKHRCALYIMQQAMIFATCCLMLLFETKIDEDLTALDRNTLELIGELFTLPFQFEVVLIVLTAGSVSAGARKSILALFHGYSVPENQPPLPTMEARAEQLRFWHELAQSGMWVCNIITVTCAGVGLTLCAYTAQPRSANVARCFFILVAWTHIVYPLIKASIRTFILLSARSGPSMDGLLNVYPDVLEFSHVGVQHPEFLAWRIQKIVEEEELLRSVYEAVDKRGVGLAEMIKEELATEAEIFRQNYEEEAALYDMGYALKDSTN